MGRQFFPLKPIKLHDCVVLESLEKFWKLVIFTLNVVENSHKLFV